MLSVFPLWLEKLNKIDQCVTHWLEHYSTIHLIRFPARRFNVTGSTEEDGAGSTVHIVGSTEHAAGSIAWAILTGKPYTTGAAPVSQRSLQAERPSCIASCRLASPEPLNQERSVTSWNRSISRSVTSQRLPMIQPLKTKECPPDAVKLR